MPIVVSAEKCSACRTCELVCAIKHFRASNYKKSAIRVLMLFPEPARNVPTLCRHCNKCIPMERCPVDAIYRAKDGTVLIDEEKCIGCRVCIEECPFGAIFAHDDIPYPIKCDLCNGKPACVEVCPLDALEFVPKTIIGQKKRVARAIKERRYAFKL